MQVYIHHMAVLAINAHNPLLRNVIQKRTIGEKDPGARHITQLKPRGRRLIALTIQIKAHRAGLAAPDLAPFAVKYGDIAARVGGILADAHHTVFADDPLD